MFTAKEVNIIKAMVEEEIGLLTNGNRTEYAELMEIYCDTLLSIINKLQAM